ncbi:uncharacterized protein LOC141687400 isoform X2 [Apium graveolens]|uniref:uncharacterized protein LOC141687400 isoform X2 n=1 Tax=Apium graveolens TaxID=4045 RepID=UPI003D7A294C
MSKIWGKIRGLFTNRSFAGTDKSGNQYFARTELIDGIMKEKRWVVFKGEHEPTSVPVEWICWLNGQRKRAPTPEEMADMEARRERVRHNVALLKKEEEERRAKAGSNNKRTSTDGKIEDTPAATSGTRGLKEKTTDQEGQEHESTEPSGSGSSFRPGTWQPPT